MRVLTLALAAFSFLAVSCTSNSGSEKNTIVGRWSGVDEKGTKGGMEFSEDGAVKFLYIDEEMPPLTYTIDYDTTPSPLNLIMVKDADTNVLNYLVEFKDASTIKMQGFFSEEDLAKGFTDKAQELTRE